MQLCLGSTYSWAIWVQPLKELTGLLQGPIHLPFTVFYVIYPVTMFFAGSLISLIGPRKCALVGGIVFGGGAALISQVGGYLMNSWGTTPFKAFFIFGFCFFSLSVLASLTMQYPPDYEKRRIQLLILSDIITRPIFWLLYLSIIYCWLFSATILAALSPILSGAAYDLWGNFMVPFLTISILLICAFFLVGKARGIVVAEQQ
jgi:MFS family permease